MSILDALILIMVPQVRLMMFSLNMVDYSTSFLLLTTQHILGRQVEALSASTERWGAPQFLSMGCVTQDHVNIP